MRRINVLKALALLTFATLLFQYVKAADHKGYILLILLLLTFFSFMVAIFYYGLGALTRPSRVKKPLSPKNKATNQTKTQLTGNVVILALVGWASYTAAFTYDYVVVQYCQSRSKPLSMAVDRPKTTLIRPGTCVEADARKNGWPLSYYDSYSVKGRRIPVYDHSFNQGNKFSARSLNAIIIIVFSAILAIGWNSRFEKRINQPRNNET